MTMHVQVNGEPALRPLAPPAGQSSTGKRARRTSSGGASSSKKSSKKRRTEPLVSTPLSL
jgi:hypothetical protein